MTTSRVRRPTCAARWGRTARVCSTTRAELAQIEERLAALPSLEETLERFREAGLEDRLKEQSLLVREERLLASIPEHLASFHECLETLKREVPMDRVFLSDKVLKDLPGKAILQRLNDVFKTLDLELQRITKDLEQALAHADDGVALVRTEWETRKKEVQEVYEKILRELQKSRVDGEEFIRLRRQIEALRPLREERQASVRRTEKEHAVRRRSLLAEWEDFKAQEFRCLDGAAKGVNKKLRDRVQVEVTAAADRDPLFKLLREKGWRATVRSDRKPPGRSRSLPPSVRRGLPFRRGGAEQDVRHHASPRRAPCQGGARGADARRGTRPAPDDRDPDSIRLPPGSPRRGRHLRTSPPARRLPRSCSCSCSSPKRRSS